MKREAGDLRDRFRGALLGAAVADALAFPYQHYSNEFLQSLASTLSSGYRSHHSGFYPEGQYSDDTQWMLAVVESILDCGEVNAECIASHFVPLWRDNLLVERDESCREPMEKLAAGLAPPGDCGFEPGHAEITPAVWCVGVALWKHNDLSALCEGIRVATTITHTDSRVLACAAAAAAAMAHNLRAQELVLGSLLDDVSNAARVFDERIADELLDLPRVLSMTEYRAVRHFLTLFEDSEYPPGADGLGIYCVPSLWTALYHMLRNPHHFDKGVERCIAIGGHVDSTALLGGAMLGALNGEHGVPTTLVDKLLNRDEIRALADRLHESWQAREKRSSGDSE